MVMLLSILAILLLLLNFPIFISLFLSALIVIWMLDVVPPVILIQTAFGSLNKFALMAVPFFIFTAMIMDTGGMSRRIVSWVEAVFGGIKGALGLTTVASCQLFGAISGSSPATVVAIGKILYPALREGGYKERFAVGLISSSACLGIVIPPSIAVIIFGALTHVSVGALFMAGIGAGAVFGAAIMLYVLYYAYTNNIASESQINTRVIIRTTKEAIWGLGTPVIILGGIYSGVFTPTEAASVSSVYAVFVVMVIYREIDWRVLIDVAAESAILTAKILIIVAASGVFSWLLALSQMQVHFATFIGEYVGNPILVIIFINVLLLVVGMFLDPNSAQVIFVPLLFPIAMTIGMDPVHFGIIVVVNLAIGMYTPPFGLNLFVSANIFNIPYKNVARSVLPFIVLGVVMLAVITWIPWISLFVPWVFGY